MQQTPCTGCNDLLNHLIGARSTGGGTKVPSTLAPHTLMTYSMPLPRFTSDGVRTLAPQRFDTIIADRFRDC